MSFGAAIAAHRQQPPIMLCLNHALDFASISSLLYMASSFKKSVLLSLPWECYNGKLPYHQNLTLPSQIHEWFVDWVGWALGFRIDTLPKKESSINSHSIILEARGYLCQLHSTPIDFPLTYHFYHSCKNRL